MVKTHLLSNFIWKIFNMKQSLNVHEPKMYIIVRGELSNIYRMVQGAHALASYAKDYPSLFQKWNNQYLIFLQVFNVVALRELIETMKNKYRLPYSVFYEPDQDNMPTAVACYTTGDKFQDLPLAG